MLVVAGADVRLVPVTIVADPDWLLSIRTYAG